MCSQLAGILKLTSNLNLNRSFQPDCHCKKCTHFETLGEVSWMDLDGELDVNWKGELDVNWKGEFDVNWM